MWTDYFRFIKLRRGRVITPSHGEIDFSRDDVPVETCRELYEKGFPYLELTEEGEQKLFCIEPEKVEYCKVSKHKPGKKVKYSNLVL
jgi:hypothetical protein